MNWEGGGGEKEKLLFLQLKDPKFRQDGGRRYEYDKDLDDRSL